MRTETGSTWKTKTSSYQQGGLHLKHVYLTGSLLYQFLADEWLLLLIQVSQRRFPSMHPCHAKSLGVVLIQLRHTDKWTWCMSLASAWLDVYSVEAASVGERSPKLLDLQGWIEDEANPRKVQAVMPKGRKFRREDKSPGKTQEFEIMNTSLLWVSQKQY